VAAWSEALALNAEIVGSNTAYGLDLCLCVSVLCCPVQVEALRRADPPYNESYQLSKWIVVSESNSELEQVTMPSPYSEGGGGFFNMGNI
jgi:hypothetical protein